MITDYLVDNFENMVKLAVGTFVAFLIAIGFLGFFVICYVIIDDWKRSEKHDRKKNSDRGSVS